MNSLYWHDYETWGADPSVDRPSQFAGVRTDEDLNIISDPLVIYCQPPEDVLPHPEACLITGIAPQKALNEGLKENEFIAAIIGELGQAGTCGVGYNSIRFDDEVTRYTLFRNFYDPYEREWANGNSRWDIIDMLRCCYALRPEGIEWPQLEGRVSFKLEYLTQANGISHAAAHDAYSDVEATIGLARLVKNKHPTLYQHLYEHRDKNKNAALIDCQKRQPLLHISSRFSVEHGCCALVVPLAMHPTNKNAVIVYDLSQPVDDWMHLDAEAIAERIFVAEKDLPEGQSRIALKLVHLNKSPVLLTPKLLTEAAADRLKIDKAKCEAHWRQLLAVDLNSKVQAAMTANEFAERSDPERKLYDGFISRADKQQMAQLRGCNGQQWQRGAEFKFSDARLQQMILRYKARNFKDALSESEARLWFEFCQKRLADGDEGVLSISQLQQRIREISEEQGLDKDKTIVLQQLYRYSQELAKRYELGKKCGW